jgi:hypothetical protein
MYLSLNNKSSKELVCKEYKCVFNRRKAWVELAFVKNCIESGSYCESTLRHPNGRKKWVFGLELGRDSGR